MLARLVGPGRRSRLAPRSSSRCAPAPSPPWGSLLSRRTLRLPGRVTPAAQSGHGARAARGPTPPAPVEAGRRQAEQSVEQPEEAVEACSSGQAQAPQGQAETAQPVRQAGWAGRASTQEAVQVGGNADASRPEAPARPREAATSRARCRLAVARHRAPSWAEAAREDRRNLVRRRCDECSGTRRARPRQARRSSRWSPPALLPRPSRPCGRGTRPGAGAQRYSRPACESRGSSRPWARSRRTRPRLTPGPAHRRRGRPRRRSPCAARRRRDRRRRRTAAGQPRSPATTTLAPRPGRGRPRRSRARALDASDTPCSRF